MPETNSGAKLTPLRTIKKKTEKESQIRNQLNCLALHHPSIISRADQPNVETPSQSPIIKYQPIITGSPWSIQTCIQTWLLWKTKPTKKQTAARFAGFSLYTMWNPLTTALCSRLALPREITLFFLEPSANVTLSPGIRLRGSGDRSRCPFGVSVLIFGSIGRRKYKGGGNGEMKLEDKMELKQVLPASRCCKVPSLPPVTFKRKRDVRYSSKRRTKSLVRSQIMQEYLFGFFYT